MVPEAEGHTRSRPGLAAVHFLPGVCAGSETGHVLEVDGQGRCAACCGQADDYAVAQRAGPVRVDLARDGTRTAWRAECGGGFA